MFRINKDFIYATIVPFISLIGVYAVWIVTHYVSSHLYVHWCVPATLIGFILSPFLVPLPYCQALRWAIFNGGSSINAMWVIFGIWLMKYFNPISNK